MRLLEVDSTELENIILGLKEKSSAGLDGITSAVVKATRYTIIPILVHIFNLCLSKGTFPDVFKTAIVHPIHKSGDRDSVSNYRPISVLSTFSKLFEKVINIRLTKYLNKFNILAPNQFGFRSGKSTDDAVLELSDTIVDNFEKKHKTIGIFLDLSKAFDTVSVPTLLSKLVGIGIRGTAYDLFSSYLTGRKQSLKIENFVSREESLTFGVPQGSVLGPTLFLIYVNELCQLHLPNCKIITYADDTALIIHGSDWNEVQINSELALNCVMKWLTKNLLTLNISKTKFIAFSTNRSSQPAMPIVIRAHTCATSSPNTTCNCPKLDSAQTIKYLGILVDSHLKWKQQSDATVTRLRKLIYVFKKLRSVVDFDSLITIYFSLAQSVLGYCLVVWGGAHKTTMLRVERGQRAILKVLAKKPMRYPTTALYSLCQVLTVRQLFILQAILRKHCQLAYDPSIGSTKRRSDRICGIVVRRTEAARRHFKHISSKMYNRINKKINIYSLTRKKLKIKLNIWLKQLNYDETEELAEV